MFWQFLSAFYLMDFFSSGEVWFEDEGNRWINLTLLRNLAIGDVGFECRSFCSAHRTYLLPAEATAVVMAIGKLIFMAPSQSPNCTAGRIPFAMGRALWNLVR